MKKRCLINVFLLYSLVSAAQRYRPVTNKTDSFSVAFIQVLNNAGNKFSEITRKHIRSTSLMGDDYQLTVPFPGSSAAIVRHRDWDTNVYIEFRGFANEEEAANGIQALRRQIKNTLGDQLRDSGSFVSPNYGMFGISDAAGYFSSNIELMAGSSSAPVYLLGPEKEQPGIKQHFILLKIYGRIPSYQYYIPAGIPPADSVLYRTFTKLLQEAVVNFKGICYPRAAVPNCRVFLEGRFVTVSRAGDHAQIDFPVTGDSAEYNKQWQFYHGELQAALGGGYVFGEAREPQYSFNFYYSKHYDATKPTVYMTKEKDRISVRIQGRHGRPLKRSADHLNDLF